MICNQHWHAKHMSLAMPQSYRVAQQLIPGAQPIRSSSPCTGWLSRRQCHLRSPRQVQSPARQLGTCPCCEYYIDRASKRSGGKERIEESVRPKTPGRGSELVGKASLTFSQNECIRMGTHVPVSDLRIFVSHTFGHCGSCMNFAFSKNLS